MEVFYTGGGIWLGAKKIDGNRYYIVDPDWECLSLYDHTNEDQDTDYPCQEMIWSKEVSKLTAAEWKIYDGLRVAIEGEKRGYHTEFREF